MKKTAKKKSVKLSYRQLEITNDLLRKGINERDKEISQHIDEINELDRIRKYPIERFKYIMDMADEFMQTEQGQGLLKLVSSGIEKVIKSKFEKQLDIIQKAADLIGATHVSNILKFTPTEAGQRYAELKALSDKGEATLRDNLEIHLFNFLKS